jgi:uncharacterized Zn finger protein (UPF0148 family)
MPKQYCTDCWCESEKSCRKCGTPLCVYCYRQKDTFCSVCYEQDEIVIIANMDNGYEGY